MADPVPEISTRAAVRGEPSYTWRAGQERRFKLICGSAGTTIRGCVLEDGCGVGEYLVHLKECSAQAVGLEFEFDRLLVAQKKAAELTCGAAEHLPFPDQSFDMVLSHEVLEHVQDDRKSVREIIRVLKPGGRLLLFVPNRGYPFETHGIYWKGKYSFGNKLFINYLPLKWRNQLAPHVRVYGSRDLVRLFSGEKVRILQKTILFGAYDNLIARFGWLGRLLRFILQTFEHTPLKFFGLSHFWVLEKTR